MARLRLIAYGLVRAKRQGWERLGEIVVNWPAGGRRRGPARAVFLLTTLWAIGTFGPAAVAATPSCGGSCVELSSAVDGTSPAPGFVLADAPQLENVGQPLTLARAVSSNPGEDFIVSEQGLVSDFYADGLVSAVVNLHYGNGVPEATDLPAYEWEYAPDGEASGLCVGLPSTPLNGTRVALEPCGVSAKTVWIVGSSNPITSSDAALISGATTNFSHPYTLTAALPGLPPFSSNLTSLLTGLAPPTGTTIASQIWGVSSGPLPGSTAVPELFDPTTNTFTALPASGAGELQTAREGAVAASLPDGDVLIAGGASSSNILQTAELFNPTTNTFIALAASGASELQTPRAGAVAALLANGNVLIAGGFDGANYPQSAELFDFSTDTFAALAHSGSSELQGAREGAVAARLAQGRVLIAGGFDGTNYLQSAETAAPAPPSAQINMPAPGQSYTLGQVVGSSFRCSDGAGGPGIKSCLDQNGGSSGAALDTSTSGAHTLTVTATSQDGQTTSASGSYTVTPTPPAPPVPVPGPAPVPGAPAVVIHAPRTGGVYALNQTVRTRFSCRDAADGPGIASCTDGSSTTGHGTLNTTRPGPHTYTVTATSKDRQKASARISYRVMPSNHFRITRLHARADGTVSFRLHVPGPGVVNVLETAWRNNLSAAIGILHPAPHRFVFTRAHRTPKHAGTITIITHPNASGRRLIAHPRYPVLIRLWVSYQPRGGHQRNLGSYGLRIPPHR